MPKTVNSTLNTQHSALILFAHGSHEPGWELPFKNIQRAVKTRQPDIAVELAFLEIMEPSLADTVARLVKTGCMRITVAPLFLAQGGHLKQDLPRILDAIRAEHPGTKITQLPAIGETDAILAAISDWLVDAMQR